MKTVNKKNLSSKLNKIGKKRSLLVKPKRKTTLKGGFDILLHLGFKQKKSLIIKKLNEYLKNKSIAVESLERKKANKILI